MMNDFRSPAKVATAMGLLTDALPQVLTHRRFIGAGNRPLNYGLVTMVAMNLPYADGRGGHRYDWSLQRVATLIR